MLGTKGQTEDDNEDAGVHHFTSLPRTVFHIVFLFHNFINHNDLDLILELCWFHYSLIVLESLCVDVGRGRFCQESYADGKLSEHVRV